METVRKYIRNQFIQEDLMMIDAEIVNEALNCQVLQDLARQLKDEKKEMKNNGWTSSQDFKQIFGNSRIEWDKISDSDISTIPAIDGKDKNRDSTIRKVIQGKSDALVIGQDPKTKLFKIFVHTYGNVRYLTGKGSYGYVRAGDSTGYRSGRSWRQMSQKDQIEMFNGLTIYYIDLSGKIQEYGKKQSQRAEAEKGTVYFDEGSLKKYAEENVERYKKIIAQNKAKSLDNDDLLDRAKAIIEKAADIATTVAKNPVKYADLISPVSSLVAWCYDKRRYAAPTRYSQKGYYYGKDGLLPTIMEYVSTVKSVSKDGGYSYQRKEIDDLVKKLTDAVEAGEKEIADLNGKI